MSHEDDVVVPLDVSPSFRTSLSEALEALTQSSDAVVAEAVAYGVFADALVLPAGVIPAVVRAARLLANDQRLDLSARIMAKDLVVRIEQTAKQAGVDLATPRVAHGAATAGPSGLLFPKCGVDLSAAAGGRALADLKAKARAYQKGLWEQVGPASVPPVEYRPGPRLSGDPLVPDTDDPRRCMIPPRYGDPDFRQFDKIIVFFSGGKDSLACLLYVLDICETLGVDPREHVEAWHHSVDGLPAKHGGSKRHIWDWPSTETYCERICDALGVKLYFSWREKGIMGEVFKGEKRPEPTAAMGFELPSGELGESGGAGDPQVRMTMPKKGKIEAGRWCSSVVKIDVGRSLLRRREDLQGKRILLVGGERSEESPNRAAYHSRAFDAAWRRSGKTLCEDCGEPIKKVARGSDEWVHADEDYESGAGHDAEPSKDQTRAWSGAHGSRGRYVEKWLPIHDWAEYDVWSIIARHGVRPHPAYRIGFGRLSCMTCIFGSPEQWATIRAIAPSRWTLFVETEEKLARSKAAALAAATRSGDEEAYAKVTRRRLPYIEKGEPLPVYVGDAQPFDAAGNQEIVRHALSSEWAEDPFMEPWRLPAGAFGEDSGPS